MFKTTNTKESDPTKLLFVLNVFAQVVSIKNTVVEVLRTMKEVV